MLLTDVKVATINAHIDTHNAHIGGAEPLDMITLAPPDEHLIRCNCPLCMGKHLTPTSMSTDASRATSPDHTTTAPQTPATHFPAIAATAGAADVSHFSDHAATFDTPTFELVMPSHDAIFGAF